MTTTVPRKQQKESIVNCMRMHGCWSGCVARVGSVVIWSLVALMPALIVVVIRQQGAVYGTSACRFDVQQMHIFMFCQARSLTVYARRHYDITCKKSTKM